MSDLEFSDFNLPGGNQKKPEREGLPAGYRMRADSHYVEQLTARRQTPLSAESPAATPAASEPIRDRTEPRERRHGRVLSQLAEDLSTIESAAGLMSNDTSAMGRRVSIDLIRAQAWRASWVLRAAAIADGLHQPIFRQRQVVSLLTQIRDGFAAECRLMGVRMQVEASDWNATVSADDVALMAGITGAIVATLSLLGHGQTEGAVIRVKLDSANGEVSTVEVSQDAVMVANFVGARFLDSAWTERPGGWVAGLGAQTARTVAQQQGGDVVFVPGEHRGSTVKLSFRGN